MSSLICGGKNNELNQLQFISQGLEMEKEQLLSMLKQTLSDYRLSRGEKKTIKEFVQHYFSEEHELAVLRSEAFDIARQELISSESKEVLDWLEEVLKVFVPQTKSTKVDSQAIFSTEQDCVRTIQNLISFADKTIDICVFTITDDRISHQLMDAAKRHVKVRIISDDEKAHDPGSDIFKLKSFGIPVRTDCDPNHMHHKFAIFDGRKLLNGSYNWTRSASHSNEENFVVTDDRDLIADFSKHFERLWKQFS